MFTKFFKNSIAILSVVVLLPFHFIAQESEYDALDLIFKPLIINTETDSYQKHLKPIKENELWYKEAMSDEFYEYTTIFSVDLKTFPTKKVLNANVERIEVITYPTDEGYDLNSFVIYLDEKEKLSESDLIDAFGEILVFSILFDEEGQENEYPTWFSSNTLMKFMTNFKLVNGKVKSIIVCQSAVGG